MQILTDIRKSVLVRATEGFLCSGFKFGPPVCCFPIGCLTCNSVPLSKLQQSNVIRIHARSSDTFFKFILPVFANPFLKNKECIPQNYSKRQENVLHKTLKYKNLKLLLFWSSWCLNYTFKKRQGTLMLKHFVKEGFFGLFLQMEYSLNMNLFITPAET